MKYMEFIITRAILSFPWQGYDEKLPSSGWTADLASHIATEIRSDFWRAIDPGESSHDQD